MNADDYHAVQVGYNRFYIDKRYTQSKPAGDGSYGFVASALDTVTGEKVAIKKIKDVFHDLVDAKRILREMKLLRHFNTHENIITIIDIMTVPPRTEVFEDVYIVTNLMESDLERIIRSRQRLTDQHYQYFLYQILRSLKYVHSANVLHRDLKPSNLLVNANCDLAICDFGLARGYHIEGEETLTEYVVTRWYRAPELLCESPYYGKGVDIWSVGCIFAELLTHEAFFRGDNPQHQLEVIVAKLGCPSRDKLRFIQSAAALQAILQYEGRVPPPFRSLFPSDSNPLALDLLSKMLTFDESERISVEDALNHIYLKDFQGQMDEPNSKALFDFSFEDQLRSDRGKLVKQLMYEEMLLYRPLRRNSKLSESKSGGGSNNDSVKNSNSDDEFMDCDSSGLIADNKEYSRGGESTKGFK